MGSGVGALDVPVEAGSVLLQYGIAGAVLFILTAVLVTYVFKYALPQNTALQNRQKEIDSAIQQQLLADLKEARVNYDAESRKQREEHKASNIEQREWFHRENEIWRSSVVEMMKGFMVAIEKNTESINSIKERVEVGFGMAVAFTETLGIKQEFLNRAERMTGERGLHVKYKTGDTKDSTQ